MHELQRTAMQSHSLTFVHIIIRAICSLLCWLYIYALPHNSTAQVLDTFTNLIPNASFEQLANPPIGWFINGRAFSRVVKYWTSPTGASPDLYGPGVVVPHAWTAKGFGQISPADGQFFIGLTLYGCRGGKPHCREYVQVPLKEPLVAGQTYAFSVKIAALPGALRINRIGVWFSKVPIQIKDVVLLHESPYWQCEQIIDPRPGQWLSLSGQFTAREDGRFLILGNFFTDAETQVQTAAPAPSTFAFAYYYFDALSLCKVPPIIDAPIPDDDLSKLEPKVGMVVTLKDIYFDFDEYELVPLAFVELEKLVRLLQRYPRMAIEIRGHTDSIGPENYNRYLSRKRAKAVVHYLMKRGIDPRRLYYKGLGEVYPIDTNETEEGRRRNRRVEFVILRM